MLDKRLEEKGMPLEHEIREITVKSYVIFQRDTLRRIHLLKSNKGNFSLRVFILDRESLGVTMNQFYMLESSLMAIVGMYLKSFADIDGMSFGRSKV